jgi:hypothetical protein
VQTLIGSACSLVLVIGLASGVDVKAATVKQDNLKINYDKLYDIQLADKLIDVKSDDNKLADDSKAIADNKITVVDKIIDDVKIDNDATIVKLINQKAQSDLLPLLKVAIAKGAKNEQATIKKQVLRVDVLKSIDAKA